MPLEPSEHRQAEVVWLAAHGMSNKQIAQTLGTCLKNVEKHLTRVYREHDLTRDTLQHYFARPDTYALPEHPPEGQA